MKQLNNLFTVSKFIKPVILFALVTFFSKGLSAQINSVILGRPTDTSVTASVMFETTVSTYIKYGTQPGVYNDSTPLVVDSANAPVFINISGLAANTKYYYTIMFAAAGTNSFTATTENHFQTQRAAGSTFTFEIESDEHLYDYGNTHLYTVTMANMVKDNPDFMISLGDFFGDDHYPFTITQHQVDSLRRRYRPLLNPLCGSVPLYICQGNHDGEKEYYVDTLAPNNLGVWATLSRKYYYPNPEPNGFYTGNQQPEMYGIGLPEDYYAFTWGDAQFIILDAYRFDCDSVDSLEAKPNNWTWTLGYTQYSWLKSTLQNSTSKYKFVFIHHPLGETRGGIIPAQLFEWGGKDKNGNNRFSTFRPGWGEPVHQLFIDYGVNVLFQGHDHLFAHEVLDSVVYQEVPMAADSTYEKGILANGDAYTADTINGSGYIRVTVSSSCVQVDYVESYLPKDTVGGLHHNDTVAFSYTLGTCTASDVKQNSNTPSLKVFPNPANSTLQVIPADNTNIKTIQIVNLMGQVIASYAPTRQIDVSNIAAGMYYVKVETPMYTAVKQVVITH